MVFSSAPFLFIFLPVVFLLYSCIRNLKAQNALLIIASLFFYGYGEPVFVIVMVASVVINYILARLVVGYAAKKKLFLVLAVIFNLGMIGVFKYAAFAVTTWNQISHMGLKVPQIALPIGISFFTFQVLSYVVDVYREPEMLQKNFWKVLLYVSFFPQLIAGPIVKYHDVYQYINDRHQTFDEVSRGIRRFVLGLSKKLFLANSMGVIADTMFTLDAGNMSAATAWLGAVCYVFQIFFDFSGYSDMAIGLGHMFGFTFLENFDHPYISTSIKGFWRRWHISLSTWFKEYLYIPLGGNRKGKIRTEVNKLIVFFFTGLWHGASWNFVLWGMIHGVSIVCEDAAGNIRAKRHGGQKAVTGAKRGSRDTRPFGIRLIGWIYTMLIVTVAFVFFRADTLGEGCLMVAKMFTGGAGNAAAFNTCMNVLSPYAVTMFIISVFACMPFLSWIQNRARKKSEAALHRTETAGFVLAVILLVLCILNIASATFNPFIYFRF